MTQAVACISQASALATHSFDSRDPHLPCPQAHPPIHPLKPYPGGDREKEALFEFIVRHFLA